MGTLRSTAVHFIWPTNNVDGNPLGKSKQGLISIASKSGAVWMPFQGMGLGTLSVDFVSP